MKAWMLAASLLGFALLILPTLEAQDEPKKTDDKPPAKKTVRPITEDDILKCAKVKGKVVSYDDASKEVTFAIAEPIKEKEFAEWVANAQAGIASAGNENDLVQRQTAFKQEYPKKYLEVFSGETKTIESNPSLRVRTDFPPPQYDASGNLKKSTPAELSKLKGGRLPGYTANLSNLRAGQIVDIYVPKAAPAPKQTAPAKKDFVGGDASLTTSPAAGKLKAYMIFVAIDAQ